MTKFTDTQDDWKRTQVRMPPKLYTRVKALSKEKALSVNATILMLIKKGYDLKDKLLSEKEFDTVIENLKVYRDVGYDGSGRVVFGSHVRLFDLNFREPDIEKLKHQINDIIEIHCHSPKLKSHFLDKKAVVDGNILKVIDGKGRDTEWIVIENVPV